MSQEARLKRLGLLHLKDKPRELNAALDRIIDRYEPKAPQPQSALQPSPRK